MSFVEETDSSEVWRKCQLLINAESSLIGRRLSQGERHGVILRSLFEEISFILHSIFSMSGSTGSNTNSHRM